MQVLLLLLKYPKLKKVYVQVEQFIQVHNIQQFYTTLHEKDRCG